MTLRDIINSCGNILQHKSSVEKHIKKFKKREHNYHDETMLTLVLANAFVTDKANNYAGVSRLLNQVISHRQLKIRTPVLSNDHSVNIEYRTPGPKHYDKFVREKWRDGSFPKHFYKDRAEKIDKRIESKNKRTIERGTDIDMVITHPNQDRVYFESKYLSDIDCFREYVPCRNQISRSLDVALYEVTNGFTKIEGQQHLWFFLITPEMFRIKEFGGSSNMNRIFHPERSRLYSYKMRDLTDVKYLQYNLPHLHESIDLKLLSERIFWMTWEEAAHFVVNNILTGEHAELVKSFYKDRGLWVDF